MKAEIKDLFQNPERDSLIVPSAYNDLGFYYSMNNNIDSAYHYYNLALKKAERSIKPTDLDTYQRLCGVIKGNMAVLKIKKQDYENAIPLLEEDARIGIKNNDDFGGTIRSLILLAECNSKLQRFQKAEENIRQIEQLLTPTINPEVRASYYQAKAELLKKLNQNEAAYNYYEKAFKLSDSINTQKQKLLLAGNDILYQLEEKDALIKEQQENINATQKRILSILALSLLMILITTSYNTYRHRATITDFITRLPDNFMKTHKGFIVNSSKIQNFNSSFVTVAGQKIPISKTHKDDVLQKLNHLISKD